MSVAALAFALSPEQREWPTSIVAIGTVPSRAARLNLPAMSHLAGLDQRGDGRDDGAADLTPCEH